MGKRKRSSFNFGDYLWGILGLKILEKVAPTCAGPLPIELLAALGVIILAVRVIED